MQKIFTIALLLTIATMANAQKGARFGVVAGVAKTRLTNSNDAAANDAKLLPLGTFNVQKGLEIGYGWRFFGLSLQIMKSNFGQKYNLAGQNAETKLKYLRSCIFFNFNTNPKNDVRFIASLGASFNKLTGYKEFSIRQNPITGGIATSTFTNPDFLFTNKDSVSGSLSNGIYYNTDASIIGALGLQIRMSPKWFMDLNARIDMGMEKLENYDKLTKTTTVNNVSNTVDYEHWSNTPYKYTKDPLYNGVRESSKNMAIGAYISLKYFLGSKSVYDYEMFGY